MVENDKQHTLVLGAGNFGTCLAQHLASKGENVVIWGRSPDIIKSIKEQHCNPRYLPDVKLSPRIQASCELNRQLLEGAATIVLAIPTQHMRQTLGMIRLDLAPARLFVSAAKGIENETNMLPLQVIGDVLGDEIAASTVVLSGPSFAVEVVRQEPTAVSMASFDASATLKAQKLFHTAYFRAYTSNDPVGLEVAGALKNVMAIAAGACFGLGMQQNAQAALLTRGLAEMTRVGVALGANPITFNGLGGVGDLFLTCTSSKSRNYSLGCYLGQGASLEEAISRLGSTAEGLSTAKAAYKLSCKLGTDTPIIDEVYAVLYQNRNLTEAVTALMNRDMKPEVTLPSGPD